MTAAELVDLIVAKVGGKSSHSQTGWMCCCPAHADSSPSLSITDAPNGKTLLHCHAGCSTESILYAIDLTMADIMGSSEPERDHDEWTPHGTAMARYPYTDEDGNLLFEVVRAEGKRFLQRRPDPTRKGGWDWHLGDVRRPLFRLPQVLEGIHAGLTVFVCYASDTEVLTRSGWCLMSELSPAVEVAAWSVDGRVRWSEPTAVQRFAYNGPMVSFAADWGDLLVTPDHRVISKSAGKGHQATVRPASMLVGKQGRLFPVAGEMAGEERGPSALEARIVAMFAADGGWTPGGGGAAFNLKKDRKKDRLRFLLSQFGLSEVARPGHGNKTKAKGWSEASYRSTPAWTRFLVHGLEFVRDHLTGVDGKSLSWAMLDWPLISRQAFLTEMGFWDGDRPGIEGIRFFTGSQRSAEVVSALASVSGYGSILREDKHHEQPTWVVSLVPRAWRQLGHPASEVQGYEGNVYCLTVDTGFLVTRRNGKVTVSGNCEGEKDVLALTKAGQVATCNPGGAGKWRPEHAETLREADVVVVADRDDVGYRHARDVVKSLEGIAIRVRLAEPATGKDVSDHLSAGLDLAALVMLGNEGPVAQLAPDIYAFLATGEEEYDWLVEGLLERGDRLLLTGFEGHGKTTLMRQLAVSMAAGLHPFRHQPITPLRVLMIDCENGPRFTRRRFRPLVELVADLGHPIPPDSFYVLTRPSGLDLTDAEDSAWLLERAHAHHPDIVLLGPLYKLHRANPNDELPARQVSGVLDDMRREIGCALILEAHSGHGENVRDRNVRPLGSSLWMRWPEFGYGIATTTQTRKGTPVDFRVWRGPRDEREWPVKLLRSSPWPWDGEWEPHTPVWRPASPVPDVVTRPLIDPEELIGDREGGIW